MTREELLELARPVLEVLRSLDPDAPHEASKALEALDASAFFAGLRAAHTEGWLTPRENAGVRFGRLAKPGPETFGFSIDVVEMSGPAAAPHTHPRGELSLCLPLEGTPRFDGRVPGPVVYPPGSRHVPTVTGGRMLIVYFLPMGEIVFE